MGWIEGNTGETGTYNLGFSSERGCGIILDSSTNIRLTSGKDSATYITGEKLQASLDNAIIMETKISPTDLYGTTIKNEATGEETNDWDKGRIFINSKGRFDTQAYNQIHLMTNKNGIIDSNTGDSDVGTTSYETEFLMRGSHTARYNTDQNSDDKLNNGFIRLQLPGTVRVSLGPDNWNEYNPYNLFEVSTTKAKFEIYNDTRAANDQNKLDPLLTGYCYNIDGFNHFNIRNVDALKIQTNTEHFLEMLNNSYIKLCSTNSLYLESGGAGGVSISLTTPGSTERKSQMKITGKSDQTSELNVENILPKNQHGIYARFA